jgi:hypothetical protein
MADMEVEAVVATIALAPGYLDRTTLVIDMTGLGRLGTFDDARVALLRRRLDPRVRLGVPSVEEACETDRSDRLCVRFRIQQYERSGSVLEITASWTNARPGRCSSATAMRVRFRWDGARLVDPWILWRDFSDCGDLASPEATAGSSGLPLAAARRLETI